MNLIASKQHGALALDIDALLQPTYLLVVELQQGVSARNGDELWDHCVKQVEQVREHLKHAGLNPRSIDLVSHAQCALLDETVLTREKDAAHAKWVNESLQAKFFNRHQAGEFLYDDMRDALREPAPDLLVLTAFQRVLMLGFRGRYRAESDPEREHVLVALTAQVGPLPLSHGLPTRVSSGWRPGLPRGLRSGLGHVVVAALLLGGVWWGLDHLLGGVIATLLPVHA